MTPLKVLELLFYFNVKEEISRYNCISTQIGGKWTLILHIIVLLVHLFILMLHTFQSADEVEKKGNSSAALQVPFLTTWVQSTTNTIERNAGIFIFIYLLDSFA